MVGEEPLRRFTAVRTGDPDELRYQPPFPLTAKLNKLTIKIDRPELSPEDIKKLEAAMRNNKSSE
jgi:hypothetical protein